MRVRKEESEVRWVVEVLYTEPWAKAGFSVTLGKRAGSA